MGGGKSEGTQCSVKQVAKHVLRKPDGRRAFELAFRVVAFMPTPIDVTEKKQSCGNRNENPDQHEIHVGSRAENSSWRFRLC